MFLNYLYFWVGCALALVAAILACLIKRQRRMILVTGVTHMPFFWMVFTLEGTYWTPTRLCGGAVGIEDILVGFGAGGITWFFVSLWPFARYLSFDFNGTLFWKRYLILSGVGMTIFFGICYGSGVPMAALILALSLGGCIVLAHRPGLWRVSLAGMVSFMVAWFIVAKTVFLLNPGMLQEWNLSRPMGRPLWGVPLGEILWGAGFGFAWPTFAAYLADARFARKATTKLKNSSWLQRIRLASP
jgi:hypothetical protein